MKSKNLSIRFIVQKRRANKVGECPIYCRITFAEKRKEFSTRTHIKPEHWDNKRQKAKLFDGNNFLNDSLTIIRKKLEDSYLKLCVNNPDFTLDDILREYKGENITSDIGLIEVYKIHSERIEKLVGKEIQLVTYSKYVETGNHLNNFIKWKFSKTDIAIKGLKRTFLNEFDYYLKTEKNFQQSTINKAIQRFRKVIRYAIAESFLERDPFLLHKPRVIKKEVVFLSRKELKEIEEFEFKDERVKLHRDLFIFCCYSGLGYKEMERLKKEDISEGFDGELWLRIFRNKTGRSYRVPMLPMAMEIAQQYLSEEREYVFPTTQNPTFNRYLKVIAKKIELNKRLTHHIARKTFATTVLLYNDVPMEIVSKLLGHTKLQTTQDHYGTIVEKRVSEEMLRISKRFK